MSPKRIVGGNGKAKGAEHQVVFPADVEQLVAVELVHGVGGGELVFLDGSYSHVLSPVIGGAAGR
jgi:hypothetical protein